MTVLKFKLKDQKLIKDGNLPFVAAGDVNTDLIAITLDDFWLDFSSYFLTIWGDSDEEPYKVTMQKSGETVGAVVPSEILANPQTVRVAIFAEGENGKRKTSSPTLFRINAGSPVDGLIPVDWNTFKSALINELNNRFQLELAGDISNEDILSAIGTLEDGKARTEFFIELLNAAVSLVNAQLLEADAPLPLLSANMEDSEIESIISDDFDLIVKIFGFYTSTMAATAQLHHEIFEESEIWETIEHNISTDIADIRAYLRSLKTRLENFRGNVIDVLPEDSITLDSSDSDIVTAITNTLDTLRAEVEASAGVERMIINSLYSLYTGGN